MNLSMYPILDMVEKSYTMSRSFLFLFFEGYREEQKIIMAKGREKALRSYLVNLFISLMYKSCLWGYEVGGE